MNSSIALLLSLLLCFRTSLFTNVKFQASAHLGRTRLIVTQYMEDLHVVKHGLRSSRWFRSISNKSTYGSFFRNSCFSKNILSILIAFSAAFLMWIAICGGNQQNCLNRSHDFWYRGWRSSYKTRRSAVSDKLSVCIYIISTFTRSGKKRTQPRFN